MKLIPKNTVELKKMKASGQVAAGVLDHITPFVVPGVSTLKLNEICAEYMKAHGAKSATLGYHGFPREVCISVNDVVCHGIPSADQILKEGDILNIDVTTIVDGFYGDTSRMYWVGNVSDTAKKLTQAAYDGMWAGIKTVKSGSQLYDIGNAIDALVRPQGFDVVREYIGHGLGRVFHEDPQVFHHANMDYPGIRLRKGLTFTIEPMVNTGTWRTKLDKTDGWTVTTADGGLSAQFEHTLAVTEGGYEIFTLSPAGYTCPPYK
jgi:methionyl aminopeptidase